MRSPPLRFLVAVLGGWAALRTAFVAPPWAAPPADAAATAMPAPARPLARPRQERAVRPAPPSRHLASKDSGPVHSAAVALGRTPSHSKLPPAFPLQVPVGPSATRLESGEAPGAPSLPQRFVAAPDAESTRRPAGRWSLVAWSFLRRGDSAPLAPSGLLGGSQAGARLAYRLNRGAARPLAVSARLSMPLRRSAGTEAALGLDWQPSRRLPVHILAERRQALGREGRSAFGLTLHGGVGDAPLGPLRIDAYVQAGVVGARSRDLFGDGSIRMSLPLGGRARLGAGAWAAAQPGLSRLDLGPQAALRLPVAGRPVTLAADWRLRVAGNAEPGSGPTLTLATDF